jgi:hypothetical protein
LLARANEVARLLGRQELTGECVVLAAMSPDFSTLDHSGHPQAQQSPYMLPFSTALSSEIGSDPEPTTLEAVIRVSLADGVSASSVLVDVLARRIRSTAFE